MSGFLLLRGLGSLGKVVPDVEAFPVCEEKGIWFHLGSLTFPYLLSSLPPVAEALRAPGSKGSSLKRLTPGAFHLSSL